LRWVDRLRRDGDCLRWVDRFFPIERFIFILSSFFYLLKKNIFTSSLRLFVCPYTIFLYTAQSSFRIMETPLDSYPLNWNAYVDALIDMRATPPAPPVKTYACDLCDKVYLRRISLFKHKLNHKHAHPGIEHICDVCGKQLYSKFTLIRHRKHHTAERPFACDRCDKAYVCKTTLARHMESMHPE
jgi:hypothetical protein